MTQRDVIYNVLRDRVGEWVNAEEFVAAGAGWRYGGRIHELRRAGHNIERRPSKSGKAPHEYRLVVDLTLWRDVA